MSDSRVMCAIEKVLQAGVFWGFYLKNFFLISFPCRSCTNTTGHADFNAYSLRLIYMAS